MGTYEFLLFIVIAVCVILVLVILSQNPKGGGLSSSFGGGGGGQMFGVQRTNNFLDKATWTISAFIVGLIIIASVIKENPNAIGNDDVPVRTEQSSDTSTAPAEEPVVPENQPAPTE